MKICEEIAPPVLGVFEGLPLPSSPLAGALRAFQAAPVLPVMGILGDSVQHCGSLR